MRTNITISIPIELKEELNKKVEKGKQSSFIAECVKKALGKIKGGKF